MTAKAVSQQGFTLIEALVALLVLAIAATGLVRASEAHVDSIRNVERRAVAQLVAQNRLAEIALHDPAASAGSVEMMGEQWTVTTADSATDDPDLHKLTVSVTGAKDGAPLVSLDGFRDLGTTTTATR